MSTLPLTEYGLLSDCHSAALVSRGGSVDWLCLPRFDAPAIFARLLDADAGHFVVRARGEAQVTRRYLDQGLVLETTFRTGGGTLVLEDCMPVGRNERVHGLGAGAPHALLRSARCTTGAVEVEVEYAPRPEYGVVMPLLRPVAGGILGRGGASVLLLSTEAPLEVRDCTAVGRFPLRAGESVAFGLQHRSSLEARPEGWDSAAIGMRIRDTALAWRTWSEHHQAYQGPWRDRVRHGGRVLQGLTFQPTGAMVAAPTTSLPEAVGGARNWDYRFTWLRDASLTLEALWVAACPDEARTFFDFLSSAALSRLRLGGEPQIMYGIAGEHDLSERVLPHLRGWRASAPVRVGNGAWRQRQLDVYGEVLAAAHLLREQLGDPEPLTRELLIELAESAASRWREPDQGIWEVRDEPRHFVHSKLMCWVALDRAIALADLLRAGDRVERWRRARDAVRAEILERGYDARVGAFTQAFDTDALDASVLLMPVVGFLPGDDPRMRSTVEAISRGLTDERGLVYRYLRDDGLAGGEGTFLVCTFWLAHARALVGDLAGARETFERAAGRANDLGLLAEEVDPTTGEPLGNYPQAFSHIGLVNAAWAVAVAEGSAGDAGPRA